MPLHSPELLTTADEKFLKGKNAIILLALSGNWLCLLLAQLINRLVNHNYVVFSSFLEFRLLQLKAHVHFERKLIWRN